MFRPPRPPPVFVPKPGLPRLGPDPATVRRLVITLATVIGLALNRKLGLDLSDAAVYLYQSGAHSAAKGR